MAVATTKWRPSSAPALLLCAHYQSDSDPTAETDRGTECHDYAYAVLRGEELKLGPHMDPMDGEKCMYAADKVVQAIKKFYPDFDLERDRGELVIEQKIMVVSDNLSIITEGTPDIWFRDILIDLKGCFDFDIANHFHKPQLSTYAVAIAKDHDYKVIHCVEVYIMPGKTREYDVSFHEAAAVVEACDSRAKNADSYPFQPSEYCHWCMKLCRGCPAINERIAVVSRNFGGIGEWANNVAGITDPQKMSIVLSFSKVMDAWIDGVKEAAKKLSDTHSDDPEYIPGFVRKSKAARAQVTDIQKAFNLSGLTPNEFLESFKSDESGQYPVSISKLGRQYQAHIEAGGGKISLKNSESEIRGRFNEILAQNQPSVFLQATKAIKKEVF